MLHQTVLDWIEMDVIEMGAKSRCSPIVGSQ
jgi:hypothetical protein